MSKGKLMWDEANLEKNEAESADAHRQKILEPKTPFHRLEEDGETPESFPPKAAAARAAGPADLLAGMDVDKLSQAALERREDGPADDEVEKHRKFAEHRKGHYNIGSLKELRQKAAAMEEDEDEDS